MRSARIATRGKKEPGRKWGDAGLLQWKRFITELRDVGDEALKALAASGIPVSQKIAPQGSGARLGVT